MSYRNDVLRTANRIPAEEKLLCSAFGLCGESGEVADLIKKSTFHGHDFDRKNLIKELGDVLWYLELACFSLNIEIENEGESSLLSDENSLSRLALKLCKRAGWCADHISDHKFDGKQLDVRIMKKRLSEIFYCVKAFSILLGTSIEEIQEINISKLKIRHPEGFSTEGSIKRPDES